MTSEVKGYFNKVVDNPVKYMYKNFCKKIMTGSWFRRFVKTSNFQKKFYGHSLTSEVKDHLYEVEDNPIKYA